MVLSTKGMGLNPDVLSFAYADMSSVSSPRLPRKKITLGAERLVQLYSSDPEELGIEIEHSADGYVRVVSTAGGGMYGGTVHEGDIICEIAGVNMRRPITEHMWKLTTGLMKVAPKPIEVVVAEESPVQEDNIEIPSAVQNVPEKKGDNVNVDTQGSQQPPFLVKQAMSMWQSLNLNGASKEEFNESPGNGTSDTASMSDANEGSTVQLPDPYSDPERFGVERRVIFHTHSLGVKLHRCPNEGIVQILHVDQCESKGVREGDDEGRLEVGDVIVEVGGVDLRHKFIGPLEWADMVYFVQNVGRPLDMVVVEDYHCMKERGGDAGATDNMDEGKHVDATFENEEGNTATTEATTKATDVSVEEERVLDVDMGVNKDQQCLNLKEAVAEKGAIAGSDETLIREDIDDDNEQNFERQEPTILELDERPFEEEDDDFEKEEQSRDGQCYQQENEKEILSVEMHVDNEPCEQDNESEHLLLELPAGSEYCEEDDESDYIQGADDGDYYSNDDEIERMEDDTRENNDELMSAMTAQLEEFVAKKEEEEAPLLLSEEEEGEEEEEHIQEERSKERIEEELNYVAKFSPEWFALKSELVELRATGNILNENKEATYNVSRNFVADDSAVIRPPNTFYFRTHPGDNKPSHIVVSSSYEAPSPKAEAEGSIVSETTSTTSELLDEPPLTPTSIIEEEDAFEVTMMTGPTTPKENKKVELPSTFGQSLFNLDDDEDEEPFTGGIDFDTPPRVPASALFSQAFIVNRGGDVGSPLFVVKKTLPDQNKANNASEIHQTHAPRNQVQLPKISKEKPALDMTEVGLHQDVPLETALSTESAWDQLTDNCFFDVFCGDSMCQGLINNDSDVRQMKEKVDKPRKKKLFEKIRKRKKKNEAKMQGYGSLHDDDELSSYRPAAAALARQKVKGKSKSDYSGFQLIDDDVDL